MGVMRAGALALIVLAAVAGVVHAQDIPSAAVPESAIPSAMRVPFGETPPTLDTERGELFVVVLGGADERRGPLTAARLSARRTAERRGRDSLHAFIDASAGHVALSPSVLEALHGTIERETRVVAIRPRVDGSANVRVSISAARLREITGAVRGLPWSA
jgi:hypothetical protein